jgi:AcrR family transcriptional regulator
MAPRAYNSETRLQQQAELKDRIAAAAARLHAQRGAQGTSWAAIAQEAGVSLPTVYKHFPDFDALIPACTSHAARNAPALPAERILAHTELPAAVHELVEAMDRLHAYYEPWLVWGEHRTIEAVARFADEQRAQLTGLCRAVLLRCVPELREAAQKAAAWEALLGFDFWHGLVRHHRLPRAAVRHTTAELLLAVTGPQPAATTLRPSRKPVP